MNMNDNIDWKKEFKRQNITTRKFNGDDAYSWAVFKNGIPVYTGLSKSECMYYKKLVATVNKK